MRRNANKIRQIIQLFRLGSASNFMLICFLENFNHETTLNDTKKLNKIRGVSWLKFSSIKFETSPSVLIEVLYRTKGVNL